MIGHQKDHFRLRERVRAASPSFCSEELRGTSLVARHIAIEAMCILERTEMVEVGCAHTFVCVAVAVDDERMHKRAIRRQRRMAGGELTVRAEWESFGQSQYCIEAY